MLDMIYRNARVVDPANRIDAAMDVTVEGGKIAEVSRAVSGATRAERDCTGLVLVPGLVDSHLHLGTKYASPFGHRMAALAGVTTCLDMAGPIDDITALAKKNGAGISVASLEGFSPMDLFGTMLPTEEQIGQAVDSALARGAMGIKILGGHWPMPLETCRRLVRLCNERGVYIAWHAGSDTAGSNIQGMREAVETVKGLRLHLAHINSYCRGRVNSVEEEAADAVQMLKDNPLIWSEAYVATANGTSLWVEDDGRCTDHVTNTCLATFGFEPTADGIRGCIRAGICSVLLDDGFICRLVTGEEGLALWEAAPNRSKPMGSFPVNPAHSRFVMATAKRSDGTFVVDAISTDGGGIPRNVQISTGLSLVKFGALTMPEFVLKTSLAPARHLRLFDRGHLTAGARADITLIDFDRQQAVETIVAGEPVMRGGKILGSGAHFIATQSGVQHLESMGYDARAVSFATEEPGRIRL